MKVWFLLSVGLVFFSCLGVSEAAAVGESPILQAKESGVVREIARHRRRHRRHRRHHRRHHRHHYRW